MLRQIEWGVQNEPIKKNGVLLVNTLFFWKLCFNLWTSNWEFIWCTNHPSAGVLSEGAFSLCLKRNKLNRLNKLPWNETEIFKILYQTSKKV